MSPAELFIVPLEAHLHEGAPNAVRESVLAELDVAIARVDAVLRSGLNPDEYKRTAAWKEALEAASRIVSQVRTAPLQLEDAEFQPA